MPVGLVSDAQLQEELDHLSGNSRRDKTRAQVVDKQSEHGRSEGDVNVPDSLRQIIGEESVINGRQSALSIAKQFGISPSSVSAYAKGATSTTTYDSPSKSIISHINKSRVRASKKAGRVLSAALEAITQDKLDYTDAKDLSQIAKNMSGIIRDMEPTNTSPAEGGDKSSPQFVIYAPQFKDERSFEFIHVSE